jgi:hypothetical protein
MSAPKRTNTRRPIVSARDGRSDWLAAFHKNVSQDGTARRAWVMLERAGLETTALRALWTYAHPPKDYVEAEQRKARNVNRAIRASSRADRIAMQRRKASDPRDDLFFDRAVAKFGDVVRLGMPFADEGTTVGDWALSRAAVGKGMPDLAASREAFVSLGARGPIADRKFRLFVLRCYAENVGVRLGLERLTALAHCADPNFDLDPRTLGRFLASLPRTFTDKCRAAFAQLPAPPLFPPQN